MSPLLLIPPAFLLPVYRIGVTVNCSCILRFDARSSDENKIDGCFNGSVTFDSH